MEKIKKMKLSIPFKWVAITAYAILIAPIIIFFFGWLRWYWAVFFSCILFFGSCWAIKKDYWKNKDCIEIPITILMGAFIAFSLWILISGCCYTSAGWCDIVWRNATFRDLVTYDWPVYYPEKNGYLCYYFVFWMIPALIGKIFGSMHIAWIALAGWFALILITAFLLISYLFKDYKKSTFKTIIVFMIMWSGINILGMFLVNKMGIPSPQIGFTNNENYCDWLWIDGEPFNFYYRSNCDFISNPYNQIPIWLAVPLMLQNRKLHNYAFLGLLVFPFSPWGTVGLALIMVTDAAYYLAKEKNIIKLIKEMFSIQNICALFSIFIVFAFFFSLANGNSKPEDGLRILPIYKMTAQIWQGTIIFWLCEFGIYYILTWKRYRKDYLYVSIFPLLMIIPFIQIGPMRDFCMDVSPPLLYILMIYVIGYVKDEIFSNKNNFSKRFKPGNCMLIFVLLLSFTTSVFNWFNRISLMNTNQSISVQDFSVVTFGDILGYGGDWNTPVSSNVEDEPFFRNLSKPISTDNIRWLPISENLSNIRNIDNIYEYLDYLSGKDCTIFVAIRDTPGHSLNQAIIDYMKKLGFDDEIDILLDKNYHSFTGIVNNGEILHEQVGGDEHIEFFSEGLINGYDVWMESATYHHDDIAAINIKNRYYYGNYCVNGRGFNIVVRDNLVNRIIDSVAFDTHSDEITCIHKAQ